MPFIFFKIGLNNFTSPKTIILINHPISIIEQCSYYVLIPNLICHYFQPPLNEPEYIDITGDNNPYEPSYEDDNTIIDSSPQK